MLEITRTQAFLFVSNNCKRNAHVHKQHTLVAREIEKTKAEKKCWPKRRPAGLAMVCQEWHKESGQRSPRQLQRTWDCADLHHCDVTAKRPTLLLCFSFQGRPPFPPPQASRHNVARPDNWQGARHRPPTTTRHLATETGTARREPGRSERHLAPMFGTTVRFYCGRNTNCATRMPPEALLAVTPTPPTATFNSSTMTERIRLYYDGMICERGFV